MWFASWRTGGGAPWRAADERVREEQTIPMRLRVPNDYDTEMTSCT
ncbi:MAG: hypothetical protein K0R33_880 [Mycobacterium sp.]|jgi:hypothetical protein|nr:hypothetical protein [Mycobacterium sp.]